MTRRNWGFDITLAAAVGLFGQLEAWSGFGSTHRQGSLWVQSLLYAVTALLLVGRRVRPLACLSAIVMVSVVEFVVVGSPEGFAVCVSPLIATYTVGSRLAWRQAWLGLVLSVLLWLAWAFFDPLNDNLVERLSSLVWLTPAIIAWLLGALARAGRLNAEQRSINLEQRASRAVAEERIRIARELHDVIGHSVSVMTVQASAVRRRLMPQQTVERHALESVESVGREALAEMRRMVGALQEAGENHNLEPMPGLDQVDRLAEKFRAAGLPVSLSITGVPRDLPPGMDLTAYRLVQEALTNTLRHARSPRRVEVAIDYGVDRIELAMRDDGQHPPGSATPAESGSGLLGMRERVTVYGGSLVATRRPGGGFELVATLPMESP